MAETTEATGPEYEAEEQAALSLETRDGIAWLTLDDPAKKVNTLSSRLFERFEAAVTQLEAEKPKGLVIRSGKKNGFVAGADIEELEGLSDPADVKAMLERGHRLCFRLAALPFPVVAAIHGAALGGGLELALACHLRVATEHKKTKLGLPEVQLGLIPGLGGTQRLPRLIGVADALPLVLTGKQVNAKKAKRLGIVDETCHPADLETAALSLLAKGKGGGRKPKKPMGQKAANWMARLPGLSNVVYNKAKEGVLKKTGGHYPAPLKAIEVIQEGMGTSLEEGLKLETQAFAELVVTDVAKNLMGIFFMKTDADARANQLAATCPREIPKVGVLGAGFMGAGIAQVLAYKDTHIVLKDRDHEGLGRGMKHIRGLFDGLVKRRRMKPMERDLAMSRVQGTVDYGGFKTADFVIEAVFEDVALKHRVIQETEAAGPEDLIFASNTSTIPIGRLAEGSAKPESLVGMHFFSPVHKMPLLEIIRHEKTSDEAVAATVKVGLRMGKTIIVVNDGPGFFTTRVLAPFMNEAAWILTQGARIEQIDKALTKWGFPVGPIALMDEVGIDIGAHVTKVLTEYFGDRITPPPAFERLIEDGRKGRKGGKGFYVYDQAGGKGKGTGKGSKKVDETVYPLLDWQEKPIEDQEIVERCWMQMLNEVAYCMEEGIISNPVDVDLGVIFGFGFPPFRGGILRQADTLGLPHVVERLEHYAAQYGDRLKPAPLLKEMAEEGWTFHQSFQKD